MGRRFFDGIPHTFALNEDHRMARLSAPDAKRFDALLRPLAQWNAPGQVLQALLICLAHRKLWLIEVFALHSIHL